MSPPDNYFVANLLDKDLPALEELENITGLSSWGIINYRKFLKEREYFGHKVVAETRDGRMKLVGFALSRGVMESLEVLKIGVYPEYQGKGIGTLLMEAAYTEGIKRGCTRCFLEVRKSNDTAIRFYHSHKFRIAGERINYYRDPVEDAWVMERRL